MAGGTGMPMGALAGAALSGRGMAPAPAVQPQGAPAPAPAPTAVAQPIAQPNATYQPAPMAPQPGFNVNQAAANSLQQAIGTAGGLANFQAQRMQAAQAAPTATYRGASINPIERAQAAQLGDVERMQGVGAVRSAMAPDQIAVDQIRTADISQYMNPYQQQVIQAGQADIERQRQMASESLAAQAQRAGAFGGSRQAVQEGVLAGEALRQAGALSAQQRQAGFQQAVESGKFDIGQTQQARTLESQQGFQAEQLGQQAREAAAAREQAARAGNMQAANRFAEQQALLEQQATMANQSAFNARAQAQAGLTQSAGLSNQAAINQAVQAQAARRQAANQANFGGQFQTAGVRAGAASQLGGLGQQAFQTGQTIQQNQLQQGLLQQGMQQALIDAAKGQYAGYTASPMQSLSAPLAALGAAPAPQSSTKSFDGGLFGNLQAGANLYSTLSKICWVAREVYGEDDPKWLQFREWVIGYSPDWFYKAYSKYGEKVAKVVAKVPALKLVIRPFMDAKRKALGYK